MALGSSAVEAREQHAEIVWEIEQENKILQVEWEELTQLEKLEEEVNDLRKHLAKMRADKEVIDTLNRIGVLLKEQMTEFAVFERLVEQNKRFAKYLAKIKSRYGRTDKILRLEKKVLSLFDKAFKIQEKAKLIVTELRDLALKFYDLYRTGKRYQCAQLLPEMSINIKFLKIATEKTQILLRKLEAIEADMAPMV